MTIEKKEVSAQPSKEASATPTDVAKSSGTAPVTPSPEETLKKIEEEQKALKQGFSKLGNAQKELDKQRAELDSLLKSYPDLLKAKEERDQLKQYLATNPYEAVKSVAGNPAEAYSKFVTGAMSDKPEMQAIQNISKQLESVNAKLKKYEDADTAREQQAAEAALIKQIETIAESKGAKVVGKSKSWGLVKNILASHKAKGEEIDLERAVELAEEGLKSELTNVLKDEDVKKMFLEIFAPPTPKEEPAPKKVSTGAEKKTSPAKTPSPSGEERPRTLAEARRRGPQLFKALMEKKTG